MTALLLKILLLLGPSILSGEESPDRMFDEACRLYRADRLEEAAALFGDAAGMGEATRSAAAFFNQGICLYQEERFAEALWAFCCAEKRRPRDGRIRSGIEAACGKLGTLPRAGGDRDGFVNTFRAAAGVMTRDEYLAAAALAASLFFLLAGARLWKGRKVGGLPFCLLVAAVCLAGFAFALRDGPRGRIGVAVQRGGLVFGEPADETQALFSLGEGEVVAVKQKQVDETWLLIRTAEGSEGWTRSVREVR